MNYRQKRNQKRLSVYTVAKELGIDYDKYLEVERGLRPLEQEYVDKMQRVLENASTIKMNRNIKMAQIKQSILDGSLKKKMIDYGYTQKEIADILNMNSTSISYVFKEDSTNVSDDTIERVYDFLDDPMNKKIKLEGRILTVDKEEEPKLDATNTFVYTMPKEEPKISALREDVLEAENKLLREEIDRLERIIEMITHQHNC